MNKNQRVTIIIAAAIGGLVLIGLVLWLGFRGTGGGVTPQPESSVKTDPITGETIIETEGIDPEGEARPSVIGASSVQPLFGNDDAFQAVANDVLIPYFETSKFIKISPKDIHKNSVNNLQTGERYLLVEFDVYLDDNTKDKHRVSVKLLPDDTIQATVLDPDGTTKNFNTSIY
jgi:hypothetical protein